MQSEAGLVPLSIVFLRMHADCGVRMFVQADFGTIVSNVATDPAVQAAAVHVMEAANTEVAALHVLSAAGPASVSFS